MNSAKFPGGKSAFAARKAAGAVVQQLEQRVLLSGLVLNNSFGTNGILQPNEGGAVVSAMMLSNGKILTAGSDFLERYNANGSRDTSFGTNGVVHFTITQNFQLAAAALAPGGQRGRERRTPANPAGRRSGPGDRW